MIDDYRTIESIEQFYEDLAVLTIGERTQLEYFISHKDHDTTVYLYNRENPLQLSALRKATFSERSRGQYVLVSITDSGERVRVFMPSAPDIEDVFRDLDNMQPEIAITRERDQNAS